MKINWAKVGMAVLTSVPNILGLSEKIQREHPLLSGPQKKEILLGWGRDGLKIADGLTERDLEANPEIMEAYSAAIDAEVAARKAVANVQILIARVKASKQGDPDPTPAFEA